MIKNEQGETVGVVLVFRDVTEKASRRERSASQRRALANPDRGAPNLVWTDLPDGQCDWLSSQWGKYTGIPENELLGLRWLETVIHPDDRERTLACWTAACADQGDYDLEYRIRRHDGEYHWFRTRGVPIRDDQGKIVYWFGTCTDIEDYKRLEAALREADRRKNEFLAILAHELRNPLAPISNGLQILRLATTGKTRDHAREMMERQLAQLVRLVDDLLDISRISRNKLELRKARITLASVIENAIETARPLIESKGHTLTVTLPVGSDLPRRRPDPAGAGLLEPAQQQRQVHRSRRTHRADRRVRRSVRHGKRARHRHRHPGRASVPALRDVLAGRPGNRSLAGRARHRAGARQGPGRDARRNRRDNLAPALGLGCEFVVRLPLAASRPRNRQSPTAQASRAGRSRRILVVDDNRDAAASLVMMLSLLGHETRMAHDGGEAVELAEAFRPDLILLDIGLPKLNGYDACRRIRQQPWGQGMVIVAATGWGQEEDRRRSREAGFDHHMVKPVDPAALVKLIASLAPAP